MHCRRYLVFFLLSSGHAAASSATHPTTNMEHVTYLIGHFLGIETLVAWAAEDVKLLMICVAGNVFEDERGHFFESWSKEAFKNIGLELDFVQDNQSLSISKGTIRGIHFQSPPKQQSKLIFVQKGSIQDIIVDIRNKSKTYGKYISIIMTGSTTTNRTKTISRKRTTSRKI